MNAPSEPQKWEYKAVNIQGRRGAPTANEFAEASKVAELLNSAGQENWELVSTITQADNILPPGFVVMKRPHQAPKVDAKKWYESARPKVTAAAKVAAPAVAKVVAPPAAQPIVAAVAALSPTAGKTDARATA